MREMVQNIAAALGATATFTYERNYPVTVNHAAQTEKAIAIARDVAGDKAVDGNHPPVMGGEDFSYMLEARPGAFIFMGNGDTAGLHHPAYDFNDAAIGYRRELLGAAGGKVDGVGRRPYCPGSATGSSFFTSGFARPDSARSLLVSSAGTATPTRRAGSPGNSEGGGGDWESSGGTAGASGEFASIRSLAASRNSSSLNAGADADDASSCRASSSLPGYGDAVEDLSRPDALVIVFVTRPLAPLALGLRLEIVVGECGIVVFLECVGGVEIAVGSGDRRRGRRRLVGDQRRRPPIDLPLHLRPERGVAAIVHQRTPIRRHHRNGAPATAAVGHRTRPIILARGRFGVAIGQIEAVPQIVGGEFRLPRRVGAGVAGIGPLKIGAEFGGEKGKFGRQALRILPIREPTPEEVTGGPEPLVWRASICRASRRSEDFARDQLAHAVRMGEIGEELVRVGKIEDQRPERIHRPLEPEALTGQCRKFGVVRADSGDKPNGTSVHSPGLAS